MAGAAVDGPPPPNRRTNMSEPIATFNFIPQSCPMCGHAPLSKWDAYGRQDFFAGASHTCPGCGLHYAYASGDKILATAAECGDMGRYVDAADVA
jgi:rubredoxin